MEYFHSFYQSLKRQIDPVVLRGFPNGNLRSLRFTMNRI